MMAEYDMSIHQNPDAKAWAQFDCQCLPDADEELMVGWFANAMMAMHDHLMNQRAGMAAPAAEIADLRAKLADAYDLITDIQAARAALSGDKQ